MVNTKLEVIKQDNSAESTIAKKQEKIASIIKKKNRWEQQFRVVRNILVLVTVRAKIAISIYQKKKHIEL